MDKYIDINKVAEAKGLTTTRAIRMKIQSGHYIAREINVQGGKSYEILFESLEYDIQALVQDNPEPYYYPMIPAKSFVPETAKTTALARIDLIKQWDNFRVKHSPLHTGDKLFLEMYNSGEYLKRLFNILGKTSKGTLKRWKLTYEEFNTWEALAPQYKYSSMNNHKTILTDEMINIFLKFLLHPNKFSISCSVMVSIKDKMDDNVYILADLDKITITVKEDNYNFLDVINKYISLV